MKIRTLVLLNGGYALQEAFGINDAFRIFKTGDFDLVIICHSIPESDRLQLISTVRKVSPSAKIIVVRNDGELSSRLADTTIHSLDGAELLLQAVTDTLSA